MSRLQTDLVKTKFVVRTLKHKRYEESRRNRIVRSVLYKKNLLRSPCFLRHFYVIQRIQDEDFNSMTQTLGISWPVSFSVSVRVSVPHYFIRGRYHSGNVPHLGSSPISRSWLLTECCFEKQIPSRVPWSRGVLCENLCDVIEWRKIRYEYNHPCFTVDWLKDS